MRSVEAGKVHSTHERHKPKPNTPQDNNSPDNNSPDNNSPDNNSQDNKSQDHKSQDNNSQDNEPERITWLVAALATLTAMLWGGNAVSVQFTQDALPPIGTAGLRFFLGSGLMFVFVAGTGGQLWLQPDQWRPALGLGVLVFAHIGLFHIGLNDTSSGHGVIIIGSHPIFVAVLAHFLLPSERLTKQKCLGLALAMGGLVLVILGSNSAWLLGWQTQLADSQTQGLPASGAPQDPPTAWADLLIVTAAMILGTRMVYTKRVLNRLDPGALALWGNITATGLFVATSLVWEGTENYRWTAAAWAGLAYQGFVVAGFCFFTWTMLLRRYSASSLSVFMFFQPISGVLCGHFLRGDQLTAWLLLGVLGVIAGVWLVNRQPNRPKQHPADSC